MTKSISWRKNLQWMGLPVTFLALGWAIWLLWDAFPMFRDSLSQIKTGWLLFVLLGNTLSAYLIFEAFYLLFEQMRTNAYNKHELANLYFTGQLIKHLPGRVWSIAYQVAMGDRASASEWIVINLVFTVLSIWFALWVSISVLAFTFDWKWGVFFLAFGTLIYIYISKGMIFDFLLKILDRFSISTIENITNSFKCFAGVQGKERFKIWLLFVSGWLVYFIAWAGYGFAWDKLTPLDGVWLCAFYTIAWFFGYISLVTPSGLGIRELVFVALARDFPPDVIATIAITSRALLLVIDLIFGVIFTRKFRA